MREEWRYKWISGSGNGNQPNAKRSRTLAALAGNEVEHPRLWSLFDRDPWGRELCYLSVLPIPEKSSWHSLNNWITQLPHIENKRIINENPFHWLMVHWVLTMLNWRCSSKLFYKLTCNSLYSGIALSNGIFCNDGDDLYLYFPVWCSLPVCEFGALEMRLEPLRSFFIWFHFNLWKFEYK